MLVLIVIFCFAPNYIRLPNIAVVRFTQYLTDKNMVYDQATAIYSLIFAKFPNG